MIDLTNLICGEQVAPVSGAYMDNVNPATGEVFARIPDSGEEDVARAVSAAKKAFGEWSATSSEGRSRILGRLADLVEAHRDELAALESRDNGKPVSLAASLDIPRAVANLRFFASAILHTATECHSMDGGALNYTLRNPIGVAGLISPWNLPLYLLTWKIAPAVATGNTVVAKPSELTPMTAHRLGELVVEAGIPEGVINIVHGRGKAAGEALIAHPDVPLISFTGGTVTGRRIAEVAAPMFKKLSLELGGKNPNIVFADADLDVAIPGSVRSSFANQGEICLCGSRIFVERSLESEFVARFTNATRQLRVGDPREATTDIGALISEAHLEKVRSYIELAQQEGGTIVCGGHRPESLPPSIENGYFLEPTIITGLGPTCRVLQEEIFGPVVTITPFDSDDEVIEFANSTRYGLSASVWTSNIGRAHRVAAALDVGTVWVNTWLHRDLRVPFGGVKDSGVGREGGRYSLEFFTETKNVCVKMSNK